MVRVTPRIVSSTSPLNALSAVRSVKRPLKRILGMVLDVEEVGAAQVGVAVGLAGPDPCRVDFALEGRVEAVVPVELQAAVDVLEQAADPGHHHVPGAELRLGMAGFEGPGGHQPSAPTRNATSSR